MDPIATAKEQLQLFQEKFMRHMSSFGIADEEQCLTVPGGACIAALSTGAFYQYDKNGNYIDRGSPDPKKTWTFFLAHHGGEEAKYVKWLEFLLSPTGPWRAILPNIVEPDPKFIMNYGWIIRDCTEMNAKLLYNFGIATRFVYEHSAAAKTWLQLLDEHGPAKAMMLTCLFEGVNRRANFNHCFISSQMHETVYRFTSANPVYDVKDTIKQKSWTVCLPAQTIFHATQPDWQQGMASHRCDYNYAAAVRIEHGNSLPRTWGTCLREFDQWYKEQEKVCSPVTDVESTSSEWTTAPFRGGSTASNSMLRQDTDITLQPKQPQEAMQEMIT